MIELHIRLQLKASVSRAFEQVFFSSYVPAISDQRGFRSAELLRSYETDEYTIVITFENEDLRRLWAESPAHAAVWPQVEELCHTIADEGFEVVTGASRPAQGG